MSTETDPPKQTRDMSASTLRIPRLVRDLAATVIEARRAESGLVSLTFSASSEAPVERFFGTEVLSHAPGAIRMERIDGGAAPLLFNHDWNDPIGMIDAGRIDGGRLIVDAHLFDTARAKEVKAMLDGGLRNVSIGYEINTLEENGKTKTFTATDWLPLEVSVVTVPADPSVGQGRDNDSTTKAVQVISTDPPPAKPASNVSKGQRMSHETNAPAGENAGNEQKNRSENRGHDSVAMERLRIKTLTDLGRQHRVDEETVRNWIDDEAVTPDDAARRVLDILVARGGEKGVNPSELGMSKKEAAAYSSFKAIRAVLNKDWSKAGLELEAHKAIQQRLGGNPLNEQTFFIPIEVQTARRHKEVRDMTSAGASGSNYLVGTDNMSFIDLLRNRSVLMQMGASRMGGLVGNVTIPRETASASTYWLTSESTAITESQPTIGQLSLSPKHVGAYTEISRLLALQSSPDAETLVMNDLAKAVGLAADLAGLAGSGASGQPQGIIGTSGVGAVTGTAMAYAGMLEFQTDIGNALSPSCGYVTTPAVAALLMQRVKFSGTASPLWDGNILDANACGFRGMSSAQVPTADIVFGAWDQVVMAEWGSLAIEVNPYANFQAGLVGVRAMYAMDIGLRVPGAFSVATTVT
ncbi:MAG: phage major capsid protein [Propionivibrio sp.]|nr:phage major capsid protein [Propionivibrio sp.]MBP8789262.1 phage major capsid protein [Azonexus sp.]